MDANHHHYWRVRSSHVTSDGFLHYEGCPCGAWRVSLRSMQPDRTVLTERQLQTEATSRR
jgi:hypothetical protein